MTATITAADAILEEIDVARIQPNPDNPRTHFRQGELDKLLAAASPERQVSRGGAVW